jgi:DNA-binding PadR family transcriptional regulator
MAREISDRDGARSLVAHGTLYRALARLEIRGLLATRWEDPRIAAAERRPRRRMYRVTAEGERAVPSMTEPTEAPVPMRSLRDETGGGRGIAAVENAAYL